MKTFSDFWKRNGDALVSLVLFILSFALYLRTLAPSIVFLFDDTLEMQYVVPRLGILHPTGYPLYTLLGKLFTVLVPLNDVAFRLNLFSAVCAALAVAMLYNVARQITTHRIAAVIAALTFAVGDTFWAQAIAAEVYALQMLLVAIILWLTLSYATRTTHHVLFALAFAMGLGLTHHRLIVLLFPAITLYVLLFNRNLLRNWKTLALAFLFFLLPLTLYLYLPLRGTVGSADGTYENSLAGFFNWVMASQYTAFLTENPLNVDHDVAYYWSLFQTQFTLVGLALAALGLVALLRRPKEWLLLSIALVLTAGFAFSYRTADVQVHFLTAFLLIALCLAAGIDVILSLISALQPLHRAPAQMSLILSFIFLLLLPLYLLNANYAANDLSQHWDVYDYGIDILNQPLEKNATIIGITGEITLIRYFQEQHNLRRDVQTIAADKEADRLRAIDNALKQNQNVYLTRPLKGAPAKYALASFGPLVRVNPPPPKISQTLNADFGAAQLIGYDIDASRLQAMPNGWHGENGKVLRVTLYWRVDEKIESDALVSVKIVRNDQRVFGQIDQRPVSGAYPTNAWRAGEIIADTYDVPLVLGITPSDYTLTVTLYDPNSNAVLGQTTLQKIELAGDTRAPRRDRWNIAHLSDADFGLLSLAGYSLNADAPIRTGDALPLTLLWRAGWQKLPDNLITRVWLEDANGKQVTSRDTLLSIGYPPFEWQPYLFVRDFPAMRLPANLTDGTYRVKLAVARNNELLGPTLLPLLSTVVDLGHIDIQNRERVMDAPAISTPLEATFDQKIKLLGYDVNVDAKSATARVTLYWRGLALMDTPYTIFVHLLDSQNRVVAAGDAEPGNGALPTTGWLENEYIIDAHTLSLNNVAPGTYQIEIGAYDAVTQARLKIGDGQDRVILTTLAVP